MKRWLAYLALALSMAGIGVYAWSYWPINAQPDEADPAVGVANELMSERDTYAEGYVQSRGNQIHFVTAGEGDPIVFLHGFPSYWFTLFGLMDAFSSNHQVIAIDGLGVGKSDAPASVEAYKLNGLVADVEAVLDHLRVNEVHLVGHDWGAALATAFAQNDPSRVNTLTAIGALPHNIILERLDTDPEHRKTFAYIDTFTSANPALIALLGAADQIWEGIYAPLYEQGFMSEAQADRLRADLGNVRRLNRFINWYRANIPAFDSIEDSDFWPHRGARIQVPTLFIYGASDQVVTEAMVDDLRNTANEIDVVRLEGVGHRPHFERYAEVVSAISTLIGDTATGASNGIH